MLGMLVTILSLNDIAVRSRLARESHVALIVSVRIPRSVLALPRPSVLPTRRPSSVWPLISVPHVIHSLVPIVSPLARTLARALGL